MPRKSKSKKASKQSKKWGSNSKKSNSTLVPVSDAVNHEELLIQQLVYGEEDHESVTSEPHTSTPEPEQVTNNAVDVEGDPESHESSEVPTGVNIKSSIDDSFSDHYSDCEPEEYKFCLESGYGVRIVSFCGRGETGQRFQLDTPALAQLVARAGAARPVVLVSVAGAFRGGKSFLLDYMLRYLYALAQAGGEPLGEDWLGGKEEPLRGFSWRGGCERETTGIMLWSQPFPVTLPTGEKVAVLLMDTQGSFDDQSSLRDCSLIFALSTLLASAQLYNISQKIKEDDLQHLQVFTEYAAAGGDGLAALQLLVRDWSAPYEYPYGAAGGARYLRDKLQVKEEQPQELRDIRQRLAASFEDLSCFLMPHPGLRAAVDPDFRGKLSELEHEFKQSLRQLVPLVLAPARLRVKHVAGRPLAAGELPVLLHAYLDEFNTRVPTPLTVLSAMARAAWLCGREAARARVRAAAPARALPRASLRARLVAAVQDALLPLPPLADRAADLPALADFEKELDVLVEQYIKTNDEKLNLTVAEAKNVFESVVRDLEDKNLCMNPLDLTATIAETRDAAMARFDCDAETDAEDPDRVQLATDLEERSEAVLRRLSAVNAANNNSAVEAACTELAWALPNLNNGCWRPDHLDAKFEEIFKRVLDSFYSRREGPNNRKRDEFVQQLESILSEHYDDLREKNERKNRTAVDGVYKKFCETMDEVCRGFRIKESDLRIKLNDAFVKGKGEFIQKRLPRSYNSVDEDSYSVLLQQKMRDRFAHYLEQNRQKLSGSEVAESAVAVGGAALVALARPRIGLPALFGAVVAALNKTPGSD